MTQTVGVPVICALNIALNLVNEPTQSSPLQPPVSRSVNLLNKTQIRGNFRTRKNLNWDFIYFLSENAGTAKT